MGWARTRMHGVRVLLVLFVAAQLVALHVGERPSAAATPAFSYRAVASSETSGTMAPAISADGRYVAFESEATDLVDDDGNDASDVFVLDRETDEIERVSVTSAGLEGDGPSFGPSISADGRFVAFTSHAALVDTDDNEEADVYVRDRFERVTILVSPTDVPGGPAIAGDVSADGTHVAWHTDRPVAADAFPQDTNEHDDVYVTELATGEHVLVSVDNDGNAANNGDSWGPSLNADGSVVAYLSKGDHFMTGVWNTERGNVWVASGGSAFPITGNDDHGVDEPFWWTSRPRVAGTANEPLVVFSTEEPLDADDDNEVADVYLWRSDWSFQRLSPPFTGEAVSMGPATFDVDVTPDGSTVVYAGEAHTPDADGPEWHRNIHRVDVDSGRTELVTQTAEGTPDLGHHHAPVVSADGVYVAFVAEQDGLDPEDRNGHPDVTVAGPPPPVVQPPVEAVIDRLEVSTSAGGGTVPAGLEEVPIADIPVSAIPLGNHGIAATPMRAIDIEAAPMRAIPMRAIPMRAIGLLEHTTLTQFPVQGGWAPRLEHTPYHGVPLQTVTIGQVEALPSDGAGNLLDEQGAVVVTDGGPVAHPLEGLTLGDLDIAATPMRAISVASIALGPTPLRAIPMRAIDIDTCTWPDGGGELSETEAEARDNWQALVDCLVAGVTVEADTTLMALDLAGVSIAAVPMRAIPMRAIDLSATPMRAIPMRAIEISATPMRAIPMRAIALHVIPMRAIPMRAIPLAVREEIFDCSKIDCDDDDVTLGDALAAGAILEGATLQLLDQGEALDGFTLGDLLEPLLAVDGLKEIDDLTLGDLLVGLLLRTDYPWERLPVADMGLQAVAPTPETVTVTIGADVVGDGDPDQPSVVTVELPNGAVYTPDTGTWTRFESGDAAWDGSTPIVSPGFPNFVRPVVSGSTLTFVIPGNGAGETTSLSFDYHPGVRLRTEQVQVTYDIGTDDDVATSADYTVVQRQRDGEPETAPILEATANTLVVGHIAEPGEVDYYRIRARDVARKRLRVDLAVPGSDKDLVLYAPTDSRTVEAAPMRAIPMRAIAVEDGVTSAVPPETLQDIPMRAIPMRAISANRDEEDEAIEILADETDDGFYTIQVSGYNGATSTDPYVLRLRVTNPPFPPECTATVLPSVTSTPTSDDADLAPEGTEALFLVSPSRMDALHGEGSGTTVLEALAELVEPDASGANALGMPGHVLEVDASKAVRDAYAAWDAAPCSPAAANGVVDELVGLVEASHLTATGTDPETMSVDDSIPFVVLVGGDDTLPQARIPDLTRLANERWYVPDLGEDNPLLGAAWSETLLSDDPYGDRDPMPWLNRLLYVPDVALGRLVETPEQIVAQLERYAEWEGSLEPTTEGSGGALVTREMTGLVTGYDFLLDGAEEVAEALDANGIDTDGRRLIDDEWTRGDLVRELLTVGDVPDVASINAHFDHHRSLPADQDKAGTEDDLFTTEDVDEAVAAAGEDLLARRILFSMGCHGGLSVPDVYIAGTRDWVEVFAEQGAVYAANTGYGYGDTAAVALSERLMTSFAEHLDGSVAVGEALMYAKQRYASEQGLYGVYDEKVLAEVTFYGLPMFAVRGEPSAPAATAASTAALSASPGIHGDAGVGVPTIPFSVTEGDDYDLVEQTAPDGSTFLTVAGERPQVTHARPIVPRLDLDVSAADGTQARGVLLTELATQDPSQAVAATFARPVWDLAEREPAEPSDVAFPAYFASVNQHRTADGAGSTLVLLPGQFRPEEGDSPLGHGVHRRMTHMAGHVLFPLEGHEDDVVPPTILSSSAESNETTATFEAEVVEEGSALRRVLVLHRDASDEGGAWAATDLAPVGDGLWRGQAPSGGAEQLEYFVQAADAGGNVGVTTNKGFLFNAAVDNEPPTVTIRSPEATTYLVGSELALDFDCEDDHLDSCTAELDGMSVTSGTTIDTSRTGQHTLVVTGEDRFGNRAEQTVTFLLGYTFEDFEAPVAAGQRTEVRAGSAVPVRWQLRDADGFVDDRSAIASITSTRSADCGGDADGGATVSDTSELAGLRYQHDEQRWQYVWKTERSWKGTCRWLTVEFSDGRTASALFRFR